MSDPDFQEVERDREERLADEAAEESSEAARRCPECGGDGELAYDEPCLFCGGSGRA